MKILVNSHKNNTIALKCLLDSMKQSTGFEKYEIMVCIGGYYSDPWYTHTVDEEYKNITYIHCNHNSVDFTALITVIEYMNTSDYYLYIHDTCVVGVNFFNILDTLDLTNVSTLRVNDLLSMNIGVYSSRIIHTFRRFLLSQKNTNEALVQQFKLNAGVKKEDYIFNRDGNCKLLNNQGKTSVTGPVDYYKTGILRIVEYYAGLDMYKTKANWHRKRHYELNN